MSRTAKLEIRSQCWKRFTTVSRMSLPRRRQWKVRRSSRPGRGGRCRRPPPRHSNRNRRHGLLRCLVRQRAEQDTGRDEKEVEVKIGNGDKCPGYQKRVKTELSHIRV